ncbi:M56 family metallopeptidase [Flavisolibacter ginsenosidimutans]|uniref:M56 family metallopeptidase n=1 Tax=Flavisolibacter ginsenosidimutans TaxID=661481 RepID=A0A5B8UF04_9BACT|nr:M56 family metallopeptidase [Flavisolibacter ginsenosidimutans]QEC54690.1 M56 family metallopeptidase [Flavisolibacter ginsenosidimutans]
MQSHFLQTLGWATLNSFWQMAILWCAFLGVNHFFKLSANIRYKAAVTAMLLGFGWFVGSAVLYYQNHSSTYAFFENTIPHSNNILNVCLFSASVTYLLLLVFPAFRLFKNWQFVQSIKKEGLEKADLRYRLFVQKIAAHLGIVKKVKLVVSSLVSSPVTVGYLKPMILLPVAAMNQLSTAQVEAVLLHELSHIRRYDYLVNFIVSIIHTLLYFNPFAKLFMNAIEADRETCCDELVLQFGYDKVGYASALLQLEKLSGRHKALALAAAGKQNLLTRIEKIVGMEKKKAFRFVQIIPLAAALICILLFNSVLIIKDAKTGTAISYAADSVFMPWQLQRAHGAKKILLPTQKQTTQQTNDLTASNQIKIDIVTGEPQQNVDENLSSDVQERKDFVHVNFDDVNGRLSKDEKERVKTTVETTKKVVGALQWKEIETSLADVMNRKEKAMARQEYYQELNKVNWQNIEQNMKANYDKLNWQVIQENVNKAMVQVQMDSLQTVYAQALTELQKAEKEIGAKAKIKCVPLPDCSVEQMNAAKETLRKNLDSLKAATRPKKVVQL